MPIQATRCAQKELADMAYWQKPENGGHTFPRGSKIPDSTLEKPEAWHLPSRAAMAVSAVMLVVVYWILKVAA